MHTLWYEFWNHFDAQIDFGKTFVTEKLVPWDNSYLKYALALIRTHILIYKKVFVVHDFTLLLKPFESKLTEQIKRNQYLEI